MNVIIPDSALADAIVEDWAKDAMKRSDAFLRAKCAADERRRLAAVRNGHARRVLHFGDSLWLLG